MKELKTSGMIFFIIAFCLLLMPSVFAQQEQITITAYYPAPYAVYFELRAQRAAIGTTYYKSSAPGYCWGSGCPNLIPPDVSLIVEGKVGIGIYNPTHKVEIVDNNLKMKIGESINNPPDDGYYVYGARNTGFWTDIPANGTNASGLGMLQAGQGRAAIWYFPGDPSMPGEPKRLNITTYNGDGIRINPSSNAGNIPFTYFAPTGNVGIGAGYNPTYNFQVGGLALGSTAFIGTYAGTDAIGLTKGNNAAGVGSYSTGEMGFHIVKNGWSSAALWANGGTDQVYLKAYNGRSIHLQTWPYNDNTMNGNESLIVTGQGNIGLGQVPQNTVSPANGGTQWNIEANDVYLRSVGKWASQASGSIKYVRTGSWQGDHSVFCPATHPQVTGCFTGNYHGTLYDTNPANRTDCGTDFIYVERVKSGSVGGCVAYDYSHDHKSYFLEVACTNLPEAN